MTESTNAVGGVGGASAVRMGLSSPPSPPSTDAALDDDEDHVGNMHSIDARARAPMRAAACAAATPDD